MATVLGPGAPRGCGLLLACLLLLLAAATASAHGVHTVHVIFSCHFDAGFGGIEPTPGLDSNIINKYFNEYFPKAVEVAEALRKRGAKERLVFMTHSWLASLYLDCPESIGVDCPKDTKAFQEAVRRGEITWHAFPHNAQVELFDADLLWYALRMTHELDRRFGLLPKITMSQRDVPGLTRAAIPILHSEGVRALTVGVNGGSAPPAVPKYQPFWWKDQASGAALLAFWHPGGYSGKPVDERWECIKTKGFNRALCASWRDDNAGPPSVEEVLEVFDKVRSEFPGAEVLATPLDDFVTPLLEAAPNLNLPVVTGELGDTWIHGVGSDPGKLAEYRELLRVRRASRDRYDDPAFKKFTRLLLKLPEHTWGCDIKHCLADYTNWANADFHAQLANRSDNYQLAIESWVRQRAYNLWAIKELGSGPLGMQAWQALDVIQAAKRPPQPAENDSGLSQVDLSLPLRFSSAFWDLELSGSTGAIVGLVPRAQQAQQAQQGGCEGGEAAEGCGAAAAGQGTTASWDRERVELRGLSELGRAPSAEELGAGEEGLLAGQPKGGRQQSGMHAGRAQQGAGFASSDYPLAEIVYSTYSEYDYSTIWNNYCYMNEMADWFYMDFGKPNSTVIGSAKRADVSPHLEAVWQRKAEDGGLHVVTKATFPEEMVRQAGAPAAIWTELRSPAGSTDLYVDVIWENKTATRLPETLWVRWRPSPEAVAPSSWVMHKLGQPISPLEVIGNGSHSLHAVGDEGVSVTARGSGSTLSIRSLDAALVSPGAPTPFPNLSVRPDLEEGMAFALVNNIWGTNYPMWVPYTPSDANMRFRFILQLGAAQDAATPPWQGSRAPTT